VDGSCLVNAVIIHYFVSPTGTNKTWIPSIWNGTIVEVLAWRIHNINIKYNAYILNQYIYIMANTCIAIAITTTELISLTLVHGFHYQV